MKKVLKNIGKVLLILLLICLALITVLCINNKIKLKKEAKLIKHQGEYVEVDGHKMNIYTEGSGDKTLVFMAGANTPAVIYDFKPLYKRLSKDYKIVVIEKFGYGYSDDIEGERSASVLLRQDREALKKAGINGPYILCPHSASGLEAISWAQEYPEEVEAIIGLDMAVPREFDYMGNGLDKTPAVTYEDTIKDEEFYNFWSYDMGLYRIYKIGNIFPASISKDLTKEERDEYKAITYYWYSKYYKTSMYREGLSTKQQIEDLKKIYNTEVPDIPTLFFVSNDSSQFNMMFGSDGMKIWEDIHKEYLNKISKSKYIKLDCGHYVHVLEAEKVSNDMKDFIKDLNN